MGETRIKDLRPGDQVTDAVYLLDEKQVRTTRNGSPYLSVRLRDASGQIEARLWDMPAGAADNLSEGSGAQVSGEVKAYQGHIQLSLQSIRPAAIDPRDFLPASPRPTAEMLGELRSLIHSVTDAWLRRLLERIFWADSDFQTRFAEAPAAKLYHHACLGGLLEHSLGVAALVEAVAPRYPQVSRDLLLAVALLHDIGKVEAYEWDTHLTLSDEGLLADHVYLGARRVERAIAEMPDFPEELRRRIVHALLSHHGDPAKGSPVRPKTAEALALHLLDELDAQLRGFQDHLDRQSDPDAVWTDKSGMLETVLYRGRAESPEGHSTALGGAAVDREIPTDDLPF